jgi:peptidase A4-like protein
VKSVRIVAAIGLVAAVGAPAPCASTLAPKPATDTSTNWAGYTIADTGATPVSFTQVTATWKQPALSCGAGAAGSAVWVGLGGANAGAGGLVQIGTNANCNAGKSRYFAFYEVTPAPGVGVKNFGINAGDTIIVAVVFGKGNVVGFRMENLTRNLAFAIGVPASPVARRSAEWIIEAPAACRGSVCGQADLANFGSVSFTKAAAVGSGHVGTILDRNWHATAVTLTPPHSQVAVTGLSHGAAPTALATDGSSFRVVWRSHVTTPLVPAPKPVSKNPGSQYIAGPRAPAAQGSF